MWSLFKQKYPLFLGPESHNVRNHLIDREVLEILHRLRRGGYESYLVGGSIRDILLGKKVKDFDIVTNAHPKQIKRLFKRCYLIGKRFRLAHVYISHNRFIEVATFRALVDPPVEPNEDARRYADNNVFGSIEEDALRRDFTINSLYYDSDRSVITDYTGGFRDISKRLLRSIGDPQRRFTDDPVRIIRAGRFCAQLGFSLTRSDLRAARKCAPLIAQANSSRMLEELYKILRSGASTGTFTNLSDYGILEHWIPEINDTTRMSTLINRLEVIDGQRSRGRDIPTAVLLTSLFFDLFSAEIMSRSDRPGYQEAFIILQEKYREFAMRLRLPKKEWDRVCNTAARFWTLSRPVNGGKRRKSDQRFAQSIYFADALRFFEIEAERTGLYTTELKYWWQFENKPSAVKIVRPEREQAHHREPAEPAETALTDSAPKKKKKRRPRKRKPPGQSHQAQAVQ